MSSGVSKTGFFFTVSKKLKAKKTQATKKLKHFFGQKLKLPEDFSKFAAKNSSYRRIFQNFRPKTPSNRQFNCPKSLVNYVFWCKIDFKHQKTLNLTILPKKSINFCKTQHISKKNSSKSQKTQANPKKTQGFGKKKLNVPEENPSPTFQKTVKKKSLSYLFKVGDSL